MCKCRTEKTTGTKPGTERKRAMKDTILKGNINERKEHKSTDTTEYEEQGD